MKLNGISIKHLNKNSIAFKLFRIMFIGLIIQMVILVSSILISNVVDTLKNDAYELFNRNVENRANSLENEMVLNFSNIQGYTSEILAIYEDIAQKNVNLNDEDTTDFLVETASILVQMLRNPITTGAFVILSHDDASGTYSGVFLKDNDPKFNHPLDTDIYMYKGPAEILNVLKTSLSSKWTSSIMMNDDNREIFSKPIEVAKQSDDISLLGYWYVSPNLEEEGTFKLTYSWPLIDDNGTVFGIVGVELTDAYFYELLPEDEIYEGSSLGYILAMNDTNTGEIIPQLIKNPKEQNSIVSPRVPLELELQDEKEDVYKILNTNTDFSVLGSIQNLNLYANNTPFKNEQWVLIGLVEENLLLDFTEKFVSVLVIAFFVTIILGILTALWSGYIFAKPITVLAEKVRTAGYKTALSLGRTGYSEIDDLSIALEGFNQKILDLGLKTDKIIHMVNLPLGTFEYQKGSDVVVCSATLLKLLDIGHEDELSIEIESKNFFQQIEKIKENIEDEEKNIYMSNEDPPQWIKLVSVEHENSFLGIGMDVTKEVLENHALKLERDYDSLTKLLNRFAFRRKADELFEQGLKDVSAFILFDLDNLKYINDTYGHDMGDTCIRSAAKILSDNLQDRGLIGRMSGDEFYVLLYGFETEDVVRKQLSNVYTSFDYNQLILPNGNKFKIRISGGIAWYGKDSQNLEELTRFADFAMYQGKHTVKGEIREFDKESFLRESFMLSGKEELNRILDNQLVDYAFQPIVSAVTGEIYAYESLLRPQSEVLNTPIKLIQIATAQSQLWKIEKITFFKTLSQYKKYKELFKNCKIFINSVPNEILKDDEYLELEKLYPEILQNVVIEIIENEKLDIVNLAKKRTLAGRWGGAIALDDYGSGYNGDISLLNLSPQIVKIDRLIIEDIEIDKNRQDIVQKLLVYAKKRNIFVLAEGVETSSQVDYLVRIGVDFLQGYYIAKPMFVPDFNNAAIAKEIQAIHAMEDV